MDYGNLASEIWNRTQDSSLDSTQITRWVNLALAQIASRADWPWMITEYETDVTVASQAEYTLQTNYKKMISVRVGDSAGGTDANATEYSFIPYKERNYDWTGYNVYYINPDNSAYGLIPTPSTAGLTIFQKYYAIPDEVTDVVGKTTTEPPFSALYHELIIFFALQKYWEMNDDGQKAVFYNSEFNNMLEIMKGDLLMEASGQLGRMKDVREFNNT